MALQQRHVETERSQLLCHVSGFALHPSELILQVLRDEDVVCVGPDSRSLVTRRRTDAGMSSAVPFFPGHGSGFFAALSVCGAIFASCQSLEIQTPNYAAWGKLRQEAIRISTRSMSGCRFATGSQEALWEPAYWHRDLGRQSAAPQLLPRQWFRHRTYRLWSFDSRKVLAGPGGTSSRSSRLQALQCYLPVTCSRSSQTDA